MTELICHTDSYIRDFTAQVLVVQADQNLVVLDRTAFYPGGGGQPYDAGTLVVDEQTLTVSKVKRQGNDIVHQIEVEGEDALQLPQVGAEVTGYVDWERRYRLMRTHTALHILCGVVWRDYGAQVTGGNMEPLKGRMDFEFEALRQELVQEIEAKVNAEVESGRQVVVRNLPRAEAFEIPDLIRTKINLLPEGIEEVRTVEIVGLDLQADGGTHVANTREVGHIRIADYKSKGRINKRLHIELAP
ncbi:MAG: Threonyl/alanyl tRNA synthetase SAD [Candidatus Entotheonella factor]|uniref:Alanine--tRNA ligase n=1 Tax=Entotheonella factor TaxID=1429438 RepID=W4L7Y5_ENTF1|nr:MAG: Threonyl/alanyl tRNA synthetase SAD [Candidatus Entotheonella factor]